MRCLAICILIAAVSGSTLAQDDFRRSAVAAATDSAVQSLLDQIEPAPLVPGLTVKQFLDRTGGRQSLREYLAHSDPVGGARWLDDHTCQVRLEVSGTEIVSDLANIAVKHAAQSPIAAGDLPNLAQALSARWFAATGTSAAEGVTPVPPPDSPWMAVPPDARRRAVQAATIDAEHIVLSSISPIELSDGHSLGEAMSDPAVGQSLTDWLASRPVTAVDYRQDQNHLEVQVTLAANASDLFDILRAAVTARNDVPHPSDPAGWALVHDDIIRRMAPPVGRAAPPSAPTTWETAVQPAQPPDWAGGMIDVVGTSGPSITELRAVRAAEADAMARLRRQVFDLPLTPALTIGQAAGGDPHLMHIVDRTIARTARLYNSQFHADGSVVVRVSMDLRLLWASIENQNH
jgi:hypothetical protein